MEISRRRGERSSGPALRVVFRRYFVNDLDHIRNHDSETITNLQQINPDTTLDTALYHLANLDTNDDQRLVILTDNLATVLPPKPSPLIGKSRSSTMLSQLSTIEQASPSSYNADSCGTTTASAVSSSVALSNSTSSSTLASEPRSRTSTMATSMTASAARQPLTSTDIYIRDRSHQKRSLICRAVVTRELAHRMHLFWSRRNHFINQDVAGSLSHSCQVSNAVIYFSCVI